MVDSMLIKGVQLWPSRGELQVFFAAALQTLATCHFRPKPEVHIFELTAPKGTFVTAYTFPLRCAGDVAF